MTELHLGPDVIQRLIPHRRPFLFVDVVTGFAREPRPTMRASRHIAANEEVFAGHFPGRSLWPGVYTIEGLGQTSLILQVILWLQDRHAQGGGEPGEILAELRQLERQLTMQAPARGAPLLARLAAGESRAGLSGQVEIKFVQPVFAGCRLDYEVTRTHTHERFARFEVEASVAGRPVARGIMTGAVSAAGDAAV